VKPKKTPHPKGPLFYLKKCLWLILGALITAAGLELFLIPNNVIDGGVVGLSIMSQTITGMGLGVFLVLYNIPFVYMGYKQIGKNFALSTVFAIIMLSIWSSLLHNVSQVTNDPFLAAIFGGVVTGLGVGIVMRTCHNLLSWKEQFPQEVLRRPRACILARAVCSRASARRSAPGGGPRG